MVSLCDASGIGDCATYIEVMGHSGKQCVLVGRLVVTAGVNRRT